MKTIFWFAVGILVVLTLAVPAEAQYNSRGGYGSYGGYGQRRPLPGGWGGSGYGYGYYDPAYLQQMMNLPDGLVACRVDLSTMKVPECHPLIKDVAIIEAHARDHADRSELLGTFHFEKGKPHFHSFDDTHQRLGTFGAGALGAGGGYIATAGTRNGWVRGGATVGGGLLAGWLASRKNHNNCLIIEPTVTRSAGLAMTPSVSGEASPAKPVGGLSLRNEGEGVAYVYDGDELVTTLSTGQPFSVGKPKRAYRAVVERFNERGEVKFVELGRRAEGQTLVFISEGQILPETERPARQ